MSALDMMLINEFRLVPALYNRNSERFKDKVYVARAWNNISKKLGYNPSVLKDRMYQLRNRYNLEKRKLQQQREEGIPNPKPMWPLYSNLNFLNGHIKQRKSFKMMKSMKGSPGFRGFTKEEGRFRLTRPYSLSRNVQNEKKQDIDHQQYESDDDMVNPSSYLNDSLDVNGIKQHEINKTSQTLKNINILKQSLLADDCADTTGQIKKARNHHPSHKYEAFGSFVNNSLQDLPQHKALVMIDRFTSEIVRALSVYRVDASNT